jgi:precorrin-6A synthase
MLGRCREGKQLSGPGTARLPSGFAWAIGEALLRCTVAAAALRQPHIRFVRRTARSIQPRRRGEGYLMRKVQIIGMGAGNPDYLTVQAIAALNEVDVFFVPDKGEEKEELRRLRLQILERFVTGRTYRTVTVDIPQRDRASPYRAGVEAWHAAIEARYADLIAEHLGETECGGFLVWGDPTLYDSTLRIIERIHANGLALDYTVIPGISSVQALAARHRIPLNRIGETVAIVPGRQLEESLPDRIDSIVVVLDGDRAYRRLKAEDVDIFWGAYLGTKDERLVSGPLAEVMDEIDTVRTREREAKGWIMDTYLVRRRRETGE